MNYLNLVYDHSEDKKKASFSDEEYEEDLIPPNLEQANKH
jgi:hypothetical protein